MFELYTDNIIKRDQKLIGLQTLLNGEEVRKRVDLFISLNSKEYIEPIYMRYKKGVNILVLYRTSEKKELFYAIAHSPEQKDKLVSAQKRSEYSSQGKGQNYFCQDIASEFCLFPNDNEIESLHRIGTKDYQERFIRKLFKNKKISSIKNIEVLRYKPERRCVVLVQGQDEWKTVIKLYTKKDYQEVLKTLNKVSNFKKTHTAKIIASSERYCALAFQWINGVQLVDVLNKEKLRKDTLKKVSADLARFHQSELEGLNNYSIKDQVNDIKQAMNNLVDFAPSFKDAAFIINKVEEQLSKQEVIKAPTHGDFYADQILIDSNYKLFFLDFDRAVLSDPAADLGQFIAHIEKEVLYGRIDSDQVKEIKLLLKEGYDHPDKESIWSRVDLHIAIGLLKLAAEPFRYFQNDCLSIAQQLVNKANEYMNRHQLRDEVHMTYLPDALDIQKIQSYLQEALKQNVVVSSSRLARYKPQRRCLIQYGLKDELETFELIGKVRAKGLDQKTFRLHQKLQEGGFNRVTDDQISVPEPVAMIADFNMCLFKKFNGQSLTSFLKEADFNWKKVAQIAYKLHQQNIVPEKNHSIKEELSILENKLPLVLNKYPHWHKRIEILLHNCTELAQQIEYVGEVCIHRDFYADQILYDGNNFCLTDLDLVCLGDPNLDIGNFIAHITEYSLREFSDPNKLRMIEDEIIQEYNTIASQSNLNNIYIYKILTLVRHVYLSTQFLERCHLTERVLEICEQEINQLLVKTAK